VVLVVALAALTTQALAAPGIPGLASQLATDVDRLADARSELEDVRTDLRELRGEHRRLRAEVEGRLVAIYKFGGSAGAIERMAAGESMRDVGQTLDALDAVAEHDQRLLERWQQLDARRTRLLDRRLELEGRVRRLERVVQRSRERLSAAEARAAAARREAERMSRIADSPLLPTVGSPENAALAEAGAQDPSVGQPIGFTQSGTASVYHDSFSGERTANGETYDPGAFTAAHPSLPFGTWVTVRGPGGTIQVRINDRGPFVGGRIIDLSAAAGAAVGISLGPVTLSVDA
jgi:hypothetical protein